MGEGEGGGGGWGDFGWVTPELGGLWLIDSWSSYNGLIRSADDNKIIINPPKDNVLGSGWLSLLNNNGAAAKKAENDIGFNTAWTVSKIGRALDF